ncbi:MAG: hypothetical protein AUI15_05910 [Actinobacteria bacterium 13_2_20CM_2_66_6]|nr:MAG: hypothetical protein AUI15_05910 [Actinobacteria bacterium 13_2_20CM_2_66_6]
MAPSLRWTVIWVSTVAPTIEVILAWLVIRWYVRRPRRPAPPDVILPDGWQRWHPDGRGYVRLYTWHAGRWREQPERRIKAEEEPAES